MYGCVVLAVRSGDMTPNKSGACCPVLQQHFPSGQRILVQQAFPWNITEWNMRQSPTFRPTVMLMLLANGLVSQAWSCYYDAGVPCT